MSGMETYQGHVRSPTDAIILFEACRIGLLPRVQRRLSEKERQSIKSGSVFVWDEREAGMRRWTDGKSWSASRVSGSFLTYREMEGKRGGSGFDKSANRDGVQGNDGDSDGGPDGYRYKPDGLMKQSFSITTNDGHHLHLISYYSRQALTANNLMLPSNDPQLRHIRPEKGMYPESTVHEQSNIPAVTRGPMGSPGYTHSPNQPPYQRAHSYGYPHPSWAPPSPMHTPPPYPQYGPYYHHPYAHHAGYPGSMHYPPPPPHGYGQHGAPPMTAYDRPPPPIGGGGLPPPGHHAYPPPPYHGAYPPPYAHGHPQYPPPPQTSYEARPAATETAPPSNEARPAEPRPAEPRPEPAKTSVSPPRAPEKTTPNPPSQSTAPGSSGQTIPSISAMLNGSENGQPPARKQSRSPNGTPLRPLQDIPSHKLGFEANRDMHTLRNLDKSTFKF